ncbi:MAG: GTPase [Acidilobaceae archaeon]
MIIAGAPNAGKSTFVRAVSTGKPEVASYPFTTKNVTLGHRVVDGFKVQFIDTPGLLDRPIEEMNKIERRAVAALSRLTGSVFFLFDPSPGAYLSLRAQRDLFVNVLKMIENKPVFIGINKVDEATPALLEESRRIALEFVKSGVAIKSYELSAIDKEAAEAVAEDLCRETLRLLGFRP